VSLVHPFPALTQLWVQPHVSIENVIPRSILGGSAPHLQDLRLWNVPFPALPELLLSTTNLVRLRYDLIAPPGYISPQAIVAGFSALTRLESLSITFLSPHHDLPERVIRITPPHLRTLLPALTHLHFRGFPEYMEGLVVRIDTPLLERTEITLFHQEVVDVSGLSKFIRRADKLTLLDRAEVTFESDRISVTLSQELLQEKVGPKTLRLHLNCPESGLQLSYLARFCASCLPTLSHFGSLHICVPFYYPWKDVMDDPDPQWLDLLRLFNTVQGLYLSKYVAPRAAQALSGPPAQRAMGVLPALETVSISGLKHLEPVKEAISEFADARRLSGHPVFIDDWDEPHY